MTHAERLQELADAATLDDVLTEARRKEWARRVIDEVGPADALIVSDMFWRRVGPTVPEWGERGTVLTSDGRQHRARFTNARWGERDIAVDSLELACGSELGFGRLYGITVPPAADDRPITCARCLELEDQR